VSSRLSIRSFLARLKSPKNQTRLPRLCCRRISGVFQSGQSCVTMLSHSFPTEISDAKPCFNADQIVLDSNKPCCHAISCASRISSFARRKRL
jgi:hypothetical protein